MMGMSPQCYIPSFVKIGPPVLEKKIFEGFTIYGRGGHLGHVTRIMYTNFHFLVPEIFPGPDPEMLLPGGGHLKLKY